MITNIKTKNQLKIIKDNFMARCYNPNNPKYKNYGARGVTVDPRWHKLKGLLETVESVDGWDEERFLNHEIQLDKDIKYKGNKLYSPETCMWATPLENLQVKPSYQKEIVAVHLSGKVYTFTHTNNFCESVGIDRRIPNAVLRGGKAFCCNFYFYYKGDTPNYPIVYRAEKDGVVHEAFKQRGLERLIGGAPSGTVHKALRKKKHNYGGWEITQHRLKELMPND